MLRTWSRGGRYAPDVWRRATGRLENAAPYFEVAAQLLHGVAHSIVHMDMPKDMVVTKPKYLTLLGVRKILFRSLTISKRSIGDRCAEDLFKIIL